MQGVKIDEQCKELSDAVKSLMKKFKNDNLRRDPGRVVKRLPDVAKAQATKVIASAVPARTTISADSIEAAVAPSMYAIAAKSSACCAEANHFSSLRLTLHGTREVVSANLLKCVDHLKTSTGKDCIPPKMVYDWLQGATMQEAKLFLEDGGVLFHGTLGVGDALVLPAGWCYAESIKQADTGGVRGQFFQKFDLPALENILSYLQKCGKSTPLLQTAVDALVTSSE